MLGERRESAHGTNGPAARGCDQEPSCDGAAGTSPSTGSPAGKAGARWSLLPLPLKNELKEKNKRATLLD